MRISLLCSVLESSHPAHYGIIRAACEIPVMSGCTFTCCSSNIIEMPHVHGSTRVNVAAQLDNNKYRMFFSPKRTSARLRGILVELFVLSTMVWRKTCSHKQREPFVSRLPDHCCSGLLLINLNACQIHHSDRSVLHIHYCREEKKSLIYGFILTR